MITALEGFFLIILASVSFRISHTMLLCMLSNFGLNPVRAARAGYDTPQTLCTTEVPFSSSSLQRERDFTRVLVAASALLCSGGVVGWTCGEGKEVPSVLSGSHVIIFCLLFGVFATCACHMVPCIRPMLRSKPEDRENTHMHTHVQESHHYLAGHPSSSNFSSIHFLLLTF